jgi:Rrf2 family protein
MLCLSQTTGYAIQALSCLNDSACACQRTAEIARCARVPKPYLAKIVQALVRRGIVRSRRGLGGGVTLARPPEQISLLEIVEAVEGPDWLGECLLNLSECSTSQDCPTYAFWQRVRAEIIAELRNTTLASVIAFKQEAGAPRRTPRPKIRRATRRALRPNRDCAGLCSPNLT